MSKVALYLQEHILGEVLTAPDARKYFATDAGIFTITPLMIIYPRNETDVRKTARFTWQLAERGRTVPITARGLGTDRSGSAIGSGIVMVFPGHMNRILEFDGKTGTVTVEPGTNFGKLQQTLHTHGRFIPSYPASLEFSTIGGAIANNCGGEKSAKYGNIRKYVKGLRVVLANGEVIETKRISKRELNKKMGLATFEGEVYRSVDALLEENHDIIQQMKRSITKNTAGYDLLDIKKKDGSFDLTPLFVGSEGTLGLVTEAQITTELHNPSTTLIAAFLDDIRLADDVLTELRKLTDGPSAAEIIDVKLLDMIHKQNPNQLKGILDPPYPKLVMMIEFDNLSQRVQKRMAKKAQKILKSNQIKYRVETENEGKERLWKIRHAASAVIAQKDGNLSALPVIDDGIVPGEKFNEYIEGVYEICRKHQLQTGVWGHVIDANLQMQPFLDLGQVGDRQKLFKVMDEYYRFVIGLGGSTSAEYGDGRIRAPYLSVMYGEAVYGVLQKVKQIFDPYSTLNPGVKINVGLDDIKPLVRSGYSLDHLYDHLPHA